MFNSLFHNSISKRILIVSSIFIISTSSVFASSQTVQQVTNYNFQLWQDYANNINAYYGTMQSSLDNTIQIDQLENLTRISQALISYSYAWNPTTSGSYSRITTDLRGQLEALSYTSALLWNRYYTYSDGNAALLNQINTNTTNMYGSQSATNVQLANLNTKVSTLSNVWSSYNTTPTYYNSDHNSVNYSSYGTLGTKFSVSFNQALVARNLYKITIPVGPISTIANDYVDFTVIYRSSSSADGTDPDFQFPYYLVITNFGGIDVYFYPIGNPNIYTELTFDLSSFSGNKNFRFTASDYFNVEYISQESPYFDDYISLIFQYRGLQKYDSIINEIDSNGNNIVNAINNKTIEAELDNSIGTDDLQIDESLPSGGLVDSARVITRLKSQFSTNVSVLDFINNYSISDLSGWYSTDNANVVQAINSSYTDLYE